MSDDLRLFAGVRFKAAKFFDGNRHKGDDLVEMLVKCVDAGCPPFPPPKYLLNQLADMKIYGVLETIERHFSDSCPKSDYGRLKRVELFLDAWILKSYHDEETLKYLRKAGCIH